MADRNIKLSEAINKSGSTDKELLNSLSEELRYQRALSDPDNPPLIKEELKEFKRVHRDSEDFK